MSINGTGALGVTTPSSADTMAEVDITEPADESHARVRESPSLERSEDDADASMVIQKDEAEEEDDTPGTGSRAGDGPSDGEGEASDVSMEVEGGVPNHEGKRVKVYELRDSSWFDRGTGHCKGVYDEARELALLIVEKEEEGEKSEDGPGGFLKDDLLLSCRVEKEDIYARQQDTLIVWTEPTSNLDIALSFQDAEGCEDIWQFICEVQRHLNIQPVDEPAQIPSSSSPLSASPILGMGSVGLLSQDSKTPWQIPTLANIKEQETLIRMQAKSPQGRERAIEHILTEDYIKHLIGVFEQAEDLDSLEDLHALCSLMQTVILLNDNGILEYILQDEMFISIIGIFEYDPDYPSLKASFRQFFQEISKFRQVVEIKDETIRHKIHQTYRLQYLKEVVLARLLDDPTFGILNGFIFFNQVDIIQHIQQDERILADLFLKFRQPLDANDSTLDDSKRDSVLFIHQLMIMGKSIQLPSRLHLYRGLLDRGLLFVCEWAFSRSEAKIIHPAAEMLTLAVDHDVTAVRSHVMKEEEIKRQTLIIGMIGIMCSTKNLGLLSQLADILRTLLEMPSAEADTFFVKREPPTTDAFLTYFYEFCVSPLFTPLLDLPDLQVVSDPPFKLSREQSALLQHLVELLSFCVTGHSHRASYFILSNSISRKVISLLYLKDKPLRHGALRFVRACLRTSNHFMHRHFVKNDLLLPLIALLEEESRRDNMLSSSCMDVLELIRKENIKPIINYLFDSYRPRLEALGTRPFFKSFILGLTTRWEQINEPPPPVAPMEAESSKRRMDEDDYFNASDDEEMEPKRMGVPVSPAPRRKRGAPVTPGSGPSKRVTRGNAAAQSSTSKSPVATSSPTANPSLGLDYDDNSDSDSSGGASPRLKPKSETSDLAAPPITPPEELEGDLSEVAMKMRAKRQREEEEEEGFAGLLVKASPQTKKKESLGPDKDKDKDKEKEKDTRLKEIGKKIRLSVGMGKKLSGSSPSEKSTDEG